MAPYHRNVNRHQDVAVNAHLLPINSKNTADSCEHPPIKVGLPWRAATVGAARAGSEMASPVRDGAIVQQHS